MDSVQLRGSRQRRGRDCPAVRGASDCPQVWRTSPSQRQAAMLSIAHAYVRAAVIAFDAHHDVQLYAVPPVGAPDEHNGAFHRSLFLFVSPSARCISRPGGVKILRCQLPRINEFYASEPSDDVLPPRLPPDQEQVSLQRDAWHVIQAERDLKGGGAASASPPLLKEWLLVVERDGDSSVWPVCCIHCAPCVVSCAVHHKEPFYNPHFRLIFWLFVCADATEVVGHCQQPRRAVCVLTRRAG